MLPASDHLLRTLASVAPGTRVVDLACGDGRHAEPLARLGFDVWASAADPAHVEAARARLADVLDPAEAARRVTAARPAALGYPDAWADWAVLTDAPLGGLADALAEGARVLRPGGWLWTEVPAAVASALDAAAEHAGLLRAEAPAEAPGRGTVHAVYRRAGTVG